MVLDDSGFVKREKAAADAGPDWTRLQQLLDRLSRTRGSSRLTDQELLELGRLYRRASAELSHARAYGLDPSETERLNHLVARAYAEIYRTEATGWRGFIDFFRIELPATFRRHLRVFGLASGLFLLAASVAGAVVLARPDVLESIAPQAASIIEEIGERHTGSRDWLPADLRPLASSAIMVNNIQVSFLAFATGILLGLGTVYVLLYNGAILGAIATGISRTPASGDFWAFVAPHGVLELPAIFVAATAGLLLGWALVDPGEYTRGTALRLAGREAIKLLMGVIVILIVAGLVEAFISPTLLPHELKFGVAIALSLLLWWYLLVRPLPRSAVAPPTAGPAP
ncbi:hypothetical protein AMK68_01335 [candidate division KD3-62 bacterium DG_56]|uniref:Stage II sporulation protein M n=1 Tax=candidate division KD3-62 bacterium DG_56 TaxID=1704032 RepID=A0A0S7XPZ9_9BACT|nr:MAG: hypothetical protein AMK68_01335 [candidate division KD3-62 bacterium DG_56]